MEENLSTFPIFARVLEECGGDWQEAQAQYFIKVNRWHANFVNEVIRTLENERVELSGVTAKMILQEVLGPALLAARGTNRK